MGFHDVGSTNKFPPLPVLESLDMRVMRIIFITAGTFLFVTMQDLSSLWVLSSFLGGKGGTA
jgi:hypothetical protein